MKTTVLKKILAYTLFTLIIISVILQIGTVAKSAQELTGIDAGSWMALIGVILGQLFSYVIREYEKYIDEKQEIEQNINMTKSIINNFLSKEINDNLKEIPIIGIKDKLQELRAGGKHKQYGFSTTKFKFEEYNRVKYDIIKYNNKLMLEVLEVYNLFYFLMDKKDLKYMSLEEIDRVVHIHDKYENKFLIKV